MLGFLTPVHVDMIVLGLLLVYVGYYKIYIPLASGKVKVQIIDEAMCPHVYWRTIQRGQFTIQRGTTKRKYHYTGSPGTVLQSGMFHSPTSYYLISNPHPLNLKSGGIDNQDTAAAEHIRTESHVLRDMLESTTLRYDPLLWYGITIAFVIMCAVGVYIGINTQLKPLQKSIDTLQQSTIIAPTPTPTPSVFVNQ